MWPGHRRHCRHGRGGANGAEIDDGTINGIKVGLMDHWQELAIHWSGERCARLPPARRISGTFGQHSRPAAVFLFFNAVRLAMKWYGLQLGFRKG